MHRTHIWLGFLKTWETTRNKEVTKVETPWKLLVSLWLLSCFPYREIRFFTQCSHQWSSVSNPKETLYSPNEDNNYRTFGIKSRQSSLLKFLFELVCWIPVLIGFLDGSEDFANTESKFKAFWIIEKVLVLDSNGSFFEI